MLDFDDSGAWRGWITLPGRDVSGAPLRDLAVTGETLRANLSGAIPSAGPSGVSDVVLHLDAGHLTGYFQQGGHRAVVLLERTGDARIATARPNTSIDARFSGIWQGVYTLGGTSREVTLTIESGPPSAQLADLLIVGRKTTRVLLDQVQQGRDLVSLGSSEQGVSIDIRPRQSDDVLEATFQQGPYEAPLVLRRTKASP